MSLGNPQLKRDKVSFRDYILVYGMGEAMWWKGMVMKAALPMPARKQRIKGRVRGENIPFQVTSQ